MKFRKLVHIHNTNKAMALRASTQRKKESKKEESFTKRGENNDVEEEFERKGF